MKKIFTLLFGIVLSVTALIAQEAPPQALSFKASIMDEKGKPIVNKTINLRISILQGDVNGFVVYSETFQTVTGTSSQVDVEIGRGNVVSGNFSSIDWSAATYFLKIEVDVKLTSTYQVISVTQLLSVPYALYAGKAGNGADPVFSAHPAHGITSGNISNWNMAYSWGNHAGLYKPISYVPDWADITSKPTLFDGTWTSLSGKPTTISGYGITDAFDGSWTNLLGKPTTIAGYGITDAFDGNWTSLINKPAFAVVATSGSYSDLINKPIIDGSETKVISGNNVLVTGDGTTASPYVVNATSSGWSLTGNAGTVDGNNFIGTTDSKPFNIRVNNEKAGRIDQTLQNTFFGFMSGNSNTTGFSNIAIGYASLFSNTTGNQNTSNGSQALFSNTSGYQNTANGAFALYANTQGVFNSATGAFALYSNILGTWNTGTGTDALRSNTTGNSNTADGMGALRSNISGNGNTANGYHALYWNTSGHQNTAVGYESLLANTTGQNNTAAGYDALYSNTTGMQNTAIGQGALSSNTTGGYNTAIGMFAGRTMTPDNANTTGSNNTFIGTRSGPGTPTQLTNATAIGYNAMVSASNSLVLGGTSADAVKVGIGVTAPAATLDVLGNIKIVDGTQGAGKVLTSDADGLASWAAAGGGGWGLTGNSGTVDGTNFIGTTDNVPFNIRVNNQKAGRIEQNLQNTFLGYQSGNFNTTGSSNTAIGKEALYFNTTGYNNTASGVAALRSNTIGVQNTASGLQALYSNTTGSHNTASGFMALMSNTDGNGNTSSGMKSLSYNTTGNGNTANGLQALSSNTTGDSNTASGFQTLYSNVAGSNATALGYNAMYYANNTTTPFTNYNVAVGFEALRGSTTASANTGNYNTALGYQTLVNNTSGGNNSAIGMSALFSNTSGMNNIANGMQALYSNTSGLDNTAIGKNALFSNTFGSNNTAFGSSALTTNKSGSNATAIGTRAMYYANNTTTAFINTNVAVGFEALRGSTTPSDNTGNNNTALGYQTLLSNTSGSNNTAVGELALMNYNGSNNTGIGMNSGISGDGITNATVIGSNAVVTVSNAVQLGDNAVTQVFAGTGSNATLIAGGLKITGGTPGVGKVLTSDANGVATWAAAGSGGSSHYIGETFGGGIVFYVYDNGQHGLIAATADQSTGIRWYASTHTNTMAFADGVGAGKANTAIIIANQGYGDGATYAARICNEYSVTVGGVTYGDWYLPSKYELNLLYLQKSMVGGFSINPYSSSTEYSNSYAYSQAFNDGFQGQRPKFTSNNVRAIRAF